MKQRLLQRTVRNHYRAFSAAFPGLTEDDRQAILAGTPDTFLALCHARHGYTRAQAIQLWNEFVLRDVDR